ncbi:hypothetical protein [Stutzerimonas stutzeri]|uniref:hypothetical protein n=1 Tax=Stutzerimonas stutzeri TaxID=316 RepID=UPI0024484E73|nr:hypothetical protein [Stutzerimonas stutzeri]MDH0425421.1 hypothetical protein [Stutzerimonas stutzeri]
MIQTNKSGITAATGALSRIHITGRNGLTLNDKWKDGPRCYLGMTTAGFPNLFIVTGPQSPGALANLAAGIEQCVDWLVGCIGDLQANGNALIEATEEAEDAWVAKVGQLAQITLHHKANS